MNRDTVKFVFLFKRKSFSCSHFFKDGSHYEYMIWSDVDSDGDGDAQHASSVGRRAEILFLRKSVNTTV